MARLGIKTIRGYPLDDIEHALLHAMEEMDGEGMTSFAEIGEPLGLEASDVIGMLIKLERAGGITITWPPEMLKLVN